MTPPARSSGSVRSSGRSRVAWCTTPRSCWPTCASWSRAAGRATRMDRRMPVDLILLSGFLGSGKTTLLVDFLRQDSAGETGVIINEVGEIGVDGAIVADTA